MPEINLKHVVSCSSEDNTHKADNLLGFRKWKVARPGEQQTSVILQFEKEERVHSIHIGNEGSAFIEVLVGNSSAVRDQDYEVLLATSSFMSPTESRNGTNTKQVRFFGSSQLRQSTAQEKWGRVKIVCSQPYNKSIAYGVAFVKLHSPDSPPLAESPKLTKLGWFKVKDKESPSAGPSLQPGSLFFNRENITSPRLKVSPQNENLSYAEAILQSSGASLSSGLYSTSSMMSSQPPRKREFSKGLLSAPAPSISKTSPSGSPEFRPEPKPHKARPLSHEQVPLKRIMQGVVFVLSGFQNPSRRELRDKALAMGAKYSPDWTPDSTHLICAFANTPKYSQVKSAGGIIVRKEWVIDCHKRKQKISCQRYSMDGAESSSESEMEMNERDTRRAPKQERQATAKKIPKVAEEDDEYSSSSDVDETGDDDDSAMDTEDELERVESRQKKKAVSVKNRVKEEDPYGGSTEEDTDNEAQVDYSIPELPDFLTGKHFFLYGKFLINERRLLLRYIVAFNGMVEDYMNEKVQFVLTSEGWHDSFEDAQRENGNLCFVKPTWIYEINEQQKILPYRPYSVVP